MVELQVKDLNAFNIVTDGPMLSLYLSRDMSISDHKAVNERWKELLLKAEFYLLKDYTRQFVDKFMKKLWQENLLGKMENFDRGLAIFYGGNFSEGEVGYARLQSPVTDLVVVADSFHIRPLIKIKNNARGFFVVTMSSRAINVLIENNGHLICLDSYKNEPKFVGINKKEAKDFFTNSAHELNKLFATYRLPIILAGVKDHIGHMRKLLNKSMLMEQSIVGNAERLKGSELLEKVQQILGPYYNQQSINAANDLEVAANKNLALTSLKNIVLSAIYGKVLKLFVVESKHIWGSLNKKTGELHVIPKKQNAHDDDILDDICQMVLATGGEIIVVEDSKNLKGQYVAAIISDRSHLFEETRFTTDYVVQIEVS